MFFCYALVLFVIILLLIKNYMSCPEVRISNEDSGPMDKGKPDIYVVEDNLEVKNALHLLEKDMYLEEPYVMGFDCEWNASTQKNQPRAPVSLLQLSTRNKVALFRLNKLTRFPYRLKEILRDESIIFVGVSCDKDAENLYDDYKIKVNSWLDLRHLYKDVEPNGLAALAKYAANIHLEKNHIIFSNWNQSILTAEQMHYAAYDAWAATKIFQSWWLKNLPNREAIVSHYVNLPFHQLHKRIKEKKSYEYDCYNRQQFSRRPVYDNNWMYAPDGELLCSCGKRKADWYIQRGLAEVISEEPYSIRLNFEPSARPRTDLNGDFYRQFKKNCCVVCGSQQSYLKHCVVPREYRKLFPETMKSHQSHDIVLLCTKCHAKAKAHMRILKEELAKLCGAPINVQHSTDYKETIKHKNYCKTLLKTDYRIPEHRKQYLEKSVKEFFYLTEINDEVLQFIVNNVSPTKEQKHTSHGERVVQYFQEQENGLMKFEEIWRKHFLNILKPRYLPSTWSVHHNHSDGTEV